MTLCLPFAILTDRSLTKTERERLWVIVIIMLFVIFFWMCFEQAGASLTFFANNPVLWTSYKGVDPETSLAGPANGQGLDYFNNPSTKSYGIRLSIGL